MATVISRHTSTISLFSQNSVQVEAGVLLQCLARHKEVLEAGCERVLEMTCSKMFRKSGNNESLRSGTKSPNLTGPRSPCRAVVINAGHHTPRRLDSKAREVLGQHLIELLATIVLPDPPQSISEVDVKLAEGLPSFPDKMMPTEAEGELLRALATKRRKGSLLLPVKEIHAAFKEFNERFAFPVSMYIVAVAEHIIGNFLQAAICFEKNTHMDNIIRATTVETLFQIYRHHIRPRRKPFESGLANKLPQNYDQCLDELDAFLHTTLEQWNLLLRVFREPLLTCSSPGQANDDANLVFGNLLDLYNNLRVFTDTLDAELEDLGSPTTGKPGALSASTPPGDASPTSSNANGVGRGGGSLDPGRLLYNRTTSKTPATASQSVGDSDSYLGSSGPPRPRLVGVYLIELAEDDSLHAFSQYASAMLGSLTRERIWALVDNGAIVPALCRLSRTILHTASLSKLSSLGTSGSVNSPATRWMDLLSFTCKRCRFWDTVASPRRRSISSTAVRTSADRVSSGNSPNASMDSADCRMKTGTRQHRASHSSVSPSGFEDPRGSVNCNYLVNAFKYLLPRLLLLPVFQFFYLHALIKTLQQCAYDDEERARLTEVLSMLTKTRTSLERDLSRNPWVCLQLNRLISTGYLVGQYRSLYTDLLSASVNPPSPSNHHATPPSPTTISPSSATVSPNTAPPSTTVGGASVGASGGNSSFKFPPSAMPSESLGSSGHANKVEEIERLLGGKDKLLVPPHDRVNLGDFIMEGRVHFAAENKRGLTEHIAYLFNGLLIVCKWQPERRTPLNPTTGQPAVLRVKHRISLENSFHVTDADPVVQPNLPAYVGHSGTVTAVEAAVLAAAAMQQGQMSGLTLATPTNLGESSTNTSMSSLLHPGLSGSVISQLSLWNTGSASLSIYPYAFEMEYLDYAQQQGPNNGFANALLTSHQPHCPYNHLRHTSPQKKISSASLDPVSLLTSVGLIDSGSVSTLGTLRSISPASTAAAGDHICTCLPPGAHVHHITLAFRTVEEKADWMASLLSLQTHRLLPRYIRTLPKLEVPLRLPSSAIYRFAQPDTADTILFEATTVTGESSMESNCAELGGSLDSSDCDLDDEDSVATDSEDYFGELVNAEANRRTGDTLTLSSKTMFDAIPTASSHFDRESKLSSGQQSSQPARPQLDMFKLNDTTTTTPITPGLGIHPQIRMATLEKLIERITYPTYFDARLVNTFLLLYRRVTTPERLLDLLIERFRIPDPEFLPEELEPNSDTGQSESPAQHMLKRFRSGYKKRIQARVIMVLSRWVRSNRYYQNDFGSNLELRRRIVEFLASIQTRHLIPSVRRVLQHLQTHVDTDVDMDDSIEAALYSPVKSPLSSVAVSRTGSLRESNHQAGCESELRVPPLLHITDIHPYKLAEQVTLYEWDLYRAVQFWEVEGRSRNSTPHLDRSKSFSNRIRNWLVYAILAEPHPDDRAVAIQRVIDLMLIMEKMNNLQGSQEAKSALISAAVFRLRKSFHTIRRLRHYREAIDRLLHENASGNKSTTSQRQSKASSFLSGAGMPPTPPDARASSIQPPSLVLGLPFATKASKAHERRIKALEKQHASGDTRHPCVPFIAAGVMTRLIHLDLRHPDTVTTESGSVLINCWKLRQLAEVIERYLAFQRIPYPYGVDARIRKQLENLDPLTLAGVESESEFETRMYELSEAYEPRESDNSSDTTSAVVTTMERRMSKEAIQAAHVLSSIPLKERMTQQYVSGFVETLAFATTTASSTTTAQTTGRVFTPSNSRIHASRSGFKSPPQSASRTSHLTGSWGTMATTQSSYKPLPTPNSVPIFAVTQSSPSHGAMHQHSNSDTQVLSSSLRLAKSTPRSSVHQAGNSLIEALGCSLSPFSFSPTASNTLPPPLPPRRSYHGSGVGQLSRTSPDPSHASEAYLLDHAAPPPLPPKISSSYRGATDILHVSMSSNPSPARSIAFTTTTSASESQCHTAFSFPMTYHRSASTDIPPPLPPRQTVSATPPPRPYGDSDRPTVPLT